MLLITMGVCAETPSYTIKKGDTLYSISKKYNIKIESLKSFNNITDPSRLYPGMSIKIPGGYTVQAGDTLFGIARSFDTTVGELMALNNLESGSLLKTGQFLHVPFYKTTEEIEEAAEATVEVEQEEKPRIVETGNDFQNWPHTGNRTELTGKLRGIQIEGMPGDDVISVAGGTVVWASYYGIYKKLVLVEGSNGLVYGYGGNEITNVNVGDHVAPGSVIGVLGGSGDKADAFFFVYKDGKPLDPEKAPRV